VSSIKPLIYFFSPLFVIFLYASSFMGEGIWDDHHFIFGKYFHQPPTIKQYWLYYIWPFFETVTDLFYACFKEQTYYWRVANFTLHLINGLMIGKLVSYYKKEWSFIITFLFWIHPLNVLSVAWIIQLKTVLAMTLCLMSLFAIYFYSLNKKFFFYIISLILFSCSILTKSSTLPVIAIALLAITILKPKKKLYLLCLPFLIISMFSVWRMHHNPIIQKTMTNTSKQLTQAVEITQATEVIQAGEAVEPNEISEAVQVTTQTDFIEAEKLKHQNLESIESSEPQNYAPEKITSTLKSIKNKLALVSYTTTYYLTMPWVPLPLAPIHGSYFGQWTYKNTIGAFIIFISIGLYVFKKTKIPLILTATQVLLLTPMLGLVTAPFMVFSVVSEQHMYLVVPIALFQQIWLLSFIPKKFWTPILTAAITVFSWATWDYAKSFKNDQTFFSKVLDVYPENRLAALSIANYFVQKELDRFAFKVILKAHEQAEKNPKLKLDPLHDYLNKSMENLRQKGITD
jgi:hypothetical protein